MKAATAAIAALAASLVLTAPAGAADKPLRFLETPDHNIGCALSSVGEKRKGSVRCDIGQHTWLAPSNPPGCLPEYGEGAMVRTRGLGFFNCPSDSVIGLGSRQVSAPGAIVTNGRFSCKVVPASALQFGVSCINRGNRHGFDISPLAINLY